MVSVTPQIASLYLSIQNDICTYGGKYLGAQMGNSEWGFAIFLEVTRRNKIIKMIVTLGKCSLQVPNEEPKEFDSYESLLGHLVAETRV